MYFHKNLHGARLLGHTVYLQLLFLSSCNSFIMLEIGNGANAVNACADQPH